MLRMKGVYDGEKVVLLEPVLLSPNTAVEVLVLEQEVEWEQVYRQRLVELGLIKEICVPPTDDLPITPIRVAGAPISQTIIEERR